jgi:hypothetical protein
MLALLGNYYKRLKISVVALYKSQIRGIFFRAKSNLSYN